MAAACISFRWLELLEKEFDKAFVDLDVTLAVMETEDSDCLYSARQRMSTLSSCFAQLTHKAQTIFQNSAKVEAELVHLRTELAQAKVKNSTLESELHRTLLQLHAKQLHRHSDTSELSPEDVAATEEALRRVQAELELEEQCNAKGHPAAALANETNKLLMDENSALRNSLLALHSEVYGARLAAKYLDKELAGRIQQLQLLGRDMKGEIRDKLWRQLEAEILLHRHKTVIRACRRGRNGPNAAPPSKDMSAAWHSHQGVGEPRRVAITRDADEGLGISITGGREHGVPILISELEPEGPAARTAALYVGDAILSVNSISLRDVGHYEAVEILSAQAGTVSLEVQYITSEDSDDDNSLTDFVDGFKFRFFDQEVMMSGEKVNFHSASNGSIPKMLDAFEAKAMINTPTAPRTPENFQGRESVVDNHDYSEGFESPAQDSASQERPLSPAPPSTLPSPLPNLSSPPPSSGRSISRLSSTSSQSMLVLGSPGRAVPVKPPEPPTPTHKKKTKLDSVVTSNPDYEYGTPV
ncbi:Golgi-associated PDZ and coiled-coil motif-containing protein-like [Neocloeon triangulifer]|uniref:Golgi-associated PDZ and coiled-coil motif-containing protein-like n=1 Tax=Neocloeon triangulifer TaxID=2078957 RepID=UPI00286F15D5|nr:Golgi-associated PDZ and coiled-coil motif-containing protein-like [Neocloeon triangulifer]